MNSLDAIGICEGWIEVESEVELINAWQYLIDSGLAFQLQGFFGRMATNLIESGMCAAPSLENYHANV